MSGATGRDAGDLAKSGSSEAAVLRTMEQYPLQRKPPQKPQSKASPQRGARHQTPPPVALPVPASSDSPVPSTAPLCTPASQAQLDGRVNAEVARRLYDLLNRQLQARQQELASEALQQQAMERAAAAALLGRPAPSPPPDHESAGPQAATRSGRRMVGLVHSGVHTAPSGGAVNSLANDFQTAPLACQLDGRGTPEDIEARAGKTSAADAADMSASAEAGFVMAMRDRVQLFRFDGTPGLNGMNLVRVKRLQAIPNHNRGLFAGLDGSPRTTRSGHFVVGRRGTQDPRVRSGAWYRLLSQTDNTTTDSGASLGIAGTGTGAGGGGGAARYPRRSGGRSASGEWEARDGSMQLKTYGAGSHSFMQLLPGSAGDSEYHNRPGTGDAGERTAAAGAAGPPRTGSGFAADLQRILDERYGRALTPQEREDARRRVHEYRQKGPKDRPDAAAGSDNTAHGSADNEGTNAALDGGLDAADVGGPWSLPSLVGDTQADKDGGHADVAGHTTTNSSHDNGAPIGGDTLSVPARNAGGRHSFDHTMNSLEARLYGATLPQENASATAAGEDKHGTMTAAGNAHSSASHGKTQSGKDTAKAHHGSGTPGSSASDSLVASPTASGAGERPGRDDMYRPHTANSRPSTTSVGPRPGDLSVTNLLVPVERPTTGNNHAGGRLGRSPTDLASRQDRDSAAASTSSSRTGSRKGGARRLGSSKGATSTTGATAKRAGQTRPVVELLTDSDNDEALDLFLAHFPETEEHVMLRKQANGFLAEFPAFDPFAWSTPSDEDGLTDADKEAQRRRRQRQLHKKTAGGSSGADKDNDADADEPLVGFDLDQARLRSKFRTEADEEYADLVAQRDRLLADVLDQRGLIADFENDVFHLSKGKAGGLTGDKYAIQLTKEVNAYAKAHHLQLNDIDLTAGSHSMEEVAEGFLDHFGKERSTCRNVATQVTDKDLGYADEGVRSAEAMLEDLVFHERGLMESIRLATVAIANIMSFHASLELESTCKECFYLFENPRTLWPCGHTFCQQCLSGMYNRNDELICAECGSICEVGYTPNLSVELVANYQTVQETAESPLNGSFGNTSVHSSRAHGTIELVLRRLLNDLLTVQRNYSPGEPPMLGTTPT